MYRIRLKVCCISSAEEAQMAIDGGADALGLVGSMPSGPGVISDELVREIASIVPPAVDTFLLTSRTTSEDIANHVNYCGTNTVQIVNHLNPLEYPELVARLPNTRIVQVIHIEDERALDLIAQYESYVHAFLLDSGRPNAETPELGGTGRTHDWSISSTFVQRSSKPVFLAGGLNPSNIKEAISEVAPFGVDLCSGIREEGKLKSDLLNQFTRNLWDD